MSGGALSYPSYNLYYMKLSVAVDVINGATQNPFPAASTQTWWIAAQKQYPFNECIVSIYRTPVAPSDGTIDWLINTMTANNGGVNIVYWRKHVIRGNNQRNPKRSLRRYFARW